LAAHTSRRKRAAAQSSILPLWLAGVIAAAIHRRTPIRGGRPPGRNAACLCGAKRPATAHDVSEHAKHGREIKLGDPIPIKFKRCCGSF